MKFGNSSSRGVEHIAERVYDLKTVNKL